MDAGTDEHTSRWVELRVHGVSGTPPGSMLDRPHVEQVGGDDESRYFVSVDAAGEVLPGRDGQVLEAYHWGRLTSGSRFNALWLFLLPFGMVNAAHYMLPAPTSARLSVALHATCDGLLRFIGLVLTSMYAFAAGLVFIDLIGWRWAGTKEGLRDSTWPVLLAVVASAGFVLLLAFLSRGYRAAGAGTPTSGSAREQVAASDARSAADTPLANAQFYSGDSRVGHLRQLHLASWLLVVAMMAVLVVHPEAWADAAWPGWSGDALTGPHVLLYAVALWITVATLVLVFGDPEGGTRTWSSAGQTRLGRTWSPLTRRLAPWLLGLSVVVLVLALATVLSTSLPRAEHPRPVAFDLIANYQLLVGVVTLTALVGANMLFVLAGGFRRAAKGDPERYFEPYAFGHAASTVALIGTFIGVALAAAIATGVSSVLGVTEGAGTAGKVTVGTTPMLDRVAYSWGLNLLLLIALVLLALVLIFWPPKRHERRQRVAGVYDVDGRCSLSDRWSRKVRVAVGLAHLKNYAGHFFVIFAGVGLVFSGVVAWELTGDCLDDSARPCRSAPGLLDYLSQPKYPVGDGPPGSSFLGVVGAWLLLAAAGALLLQSRQALKAEEKRRALNVIWDVLSFWPQAIHPFAPRPYSKRCVEDLGKRIRHHLAGTRAADGLPRDLVLCGHSQGSLISFATLLQLEPDLRDRVALVTFGSQLRVIFPRAFPAYVNYASIRRLYDDLGGAWINLYRLTDPIAGPVLSWQHRTGHSGPPTSWHFPAAGDWTHGWSPTSQANSFDGPHRTLKCGADWQLADPVPADPDLQTGAVAELLRHSWFARHPDWHSCVDLVRTVPPPGSDPEATTDDATGAVDAPAATEPAETPTSDTRQGVGMGGARWPRQPVGPGSAHVTGNETSAPATPTAPGPHSRPSGSHRDS